jgi:hypothetical protein
MQGQSTAENFTLQKLKAQRKTMDIPDASYDLDGDGIICSREYFLAKCFDLDRDNHLSNKERSNAMQAIANGYEDQFVWNLEKTNSNNAQRILQIRGKIVQAEDFLPIRDTYPSMNFSSPKVKTRRELNKLRRQQTLNSLKEKQEEWEKLNPNSVLQEYKLSEYLIDNPK